jgi:hypothetical protein
MVDIKIQVIVDQNGNLITAYKPQSINLHNGETINTAIRPGLPGHTLYEMDVPDNILKGAEINTSEIAKLIKSKPQSLRAVLPRSQSAPEQ